MIKIISQSPPADYMEFINGLGWRSIYSDTIKRLRSSEYLNTP